MGGYGEGEWCEYNRKCNDKQTQKNVTTTNQFPSFVAYRRKEVCMHPHAKKRVCTPTEQSIRTHVSACTSKSKRCFVREHQKLMLGMRKHTCIHA